jgi:hypothetical protein
VVFLGEFGALIVCLLSGYFNISFFLCCCVFGFGCFFKNLSCYNFFILCDLFHFIADSCTCCLLAFAKVVDLVLFSFFLAFATHLSNQSIGREIQLLLLLLLLL